MRSVRCDACGTKALMAASQCPKCGHLFEVRDGFGALVPLSYCSSCDSHYPATAGSCKWCGTAPEPAPRGPLPWGKIGVGALVAMLWGVWLMRDPHPKPVAHTKTAAGLRVENIAPLDSTVPVVTAPSLRSPVAERTPPTAEPPIESVRDTITAANTAVSTTPATSVTPDPEPASAVNAPAPVTPRAAPRWVTLLSRKWLVVRTDARANAHIVASIGPDSRVQLGETAGSWRRIRSRDIAGWVDVRRATFVPVRPSTRSRGLAER
jgi:hypothetical protein